MYVNKITNKDYIILHTLLICLISEPLPHFLVLFVILLQYSSLDVYSAYIRHKYEKHETKEVSLNINLTVINHFSLMLLKLHIILQHIDFGSEKREMCVCKWLFLDVFVCIWARWWWIIEFMIWKLFWCINKRLRDF